LRRGSGLGWRRGWWRGEVGRVAFQGRRRRGKVVGGRMRWEGTDIVVEVVGWLVDLVVRIERGILSISL